MAVGLPLDATAATLAAIRAALLADATLPGLLAGNKIMVMAPSSCPTPYIEMSPSGGDYSTATEDGQDLKIDLHIWHQPSSQTPETATAMQIMGLVRQIMHTATLAPAAPFHCVFCRVTNQIGPYHDPDGATLHGVVTVRVVVDHA